MRGVTVMLPHRQLVAQRDGPAYNDDTGNVSHGTVTRRVYHSDVTSGERELYMYTRRAMRAPRRIRCSASSAAGPATTGPPGVTCSATTSRRVGGARTDFATNEPISW